MPETIFAARGGPARSSSLTIYRHFYLAIDRPSEKKSRMPQLLNSAGCGVGDVIRFPDGSVL